MSEAQVMSHKWHICIDHQLTDVDARLCASCVCYALPLIGVTFFSLILDCEQKLRFPLGMRAHCMYVDIDDKFCKVDDSSSLCLLDFISVSNHFYLGFSPASKIITLFHKC